MILDILELPYRYSHNYHGNRNALFINTPEFEFIVPQGLMFNLCEAIFKYKIIEQYNGLIVERLVLTTEPWKNNRQRLDIYPISLKIIDGQGYNANLLFIKGVAEFIIDHTTTDYLPTRTGFTSVANVYTGMLKTELDSVDENVSDILANMIDKNNKVHTSISNLDPTVNSVNFYKILNNLIDVSLCISRNSLGYSLLENVYEKDIYPYFGEKHFVDRITEKCFDGIIDIRDDLKKSCRCEQIINIDDIESYVQDVTIDEELLVSDVFLEFAETLHSTPITDIKFIYDLNSNTIENIYSVNRYKYCNLTLSAWYSNLRKIHLSEIVKILTAKHSKSIWRIEFVKTFKEELFVELVFTDKSSIKYYFDLVMMILTSKKLLYI